MTNPFTRYSYPVTGSSTLRTTPNRLVDVINVKDYGATGDGITDDHDAIMAAWNWTVSTNRGIIFFPPGTYYTSAPLDISLEVGIFWIKGVLGASTIRGNFNDYVIKKADAAFAPGYISGLTVINDHATGKGIKLGGASGSTLRDCNIIANVAFNSQGNDAADGGGTSLEMTVTNCSFSPGANTVGSIGMVLVSNGAISNCRIIGFSKGVITWGHQGGQAFQGCYFEGNEIALRPGMRVEGTDESTPGEGLSGCHFKNIGTAMHIIGNVGGSIALQGIYIEADEDVTVYGSRPQYGIRLLNTTANFSGVVVEGQYEQAAIEVDNSPSLNGSTYDGVSAFNTSMYGGVDWDFISIDPKARFTGCNCPASAIIMTFASLPTLSAQVRSGDWDSGTGLTSMRMYTNLGPYNGMSIQITIVGLSPAGYNGTFTTTVVTGGDTLVYAQSDPGAPSATGNPFAVLNINGAVKEADTYNISDSTASGWGDNPVGGGGGTTHAKIRQGSNGWTVVGV